MLSVDIIIALRKLRFRASIMRGSVNLPNVDLMENQLPPYRGSNKRENKANDVTKRSTSKFPTPDVSTELVRRKYTFILENNIAIL